MFTNSFCNCADCDSVLVFSAIEADQNCIPETFLSEISGLMLFEDSADLPTDWTDAEDWEAVINNLDITGTYGKYVVGIGSMAAPEKVSVLIGKGKSATVTKTYTVSFNVLNLSDAQYAFLRQLQCNPTNYRFFVETNGGHILGSSVGIRPSFTDVDFIYGSGQETVEQATLTIQWKAKCDPDRTYLPNLSDGFTATATAFNVYGPALGGDTAYGTAAGGDTLYGPVAS